MAAQAPEGYAAADLAANSVSAASAPPASLCAGKLACARTGPATAHAMWPQPARRSDRMRRDLAGQGGGAQLLAAHPVDEASLQSPRRIRGK